MIIALIILSAIGICKKVYYETMIKPSIVHSDVKSIDLSTLYEIKITNNNEIITLKPDKNEFQTISKIFNKKKVKIDNTRVYFWDDKKFKIEFKTNNQSYTLYGYPEIIINDTNQSLSNPVVFVLYDYTDENSMEYLYQIVTITKSDFLKIFDEHQIESVD